MKLRNKKTGKIGSFCYGRASELCVSWQKDDGFWDKQEYNSLAELNAEWEDYEEAKQHWFIATDGRVLECNEDSYNGYACYDGEKAIGNYFETKEEAKKAVEKLKAWKRLKSCGFKFSFWDRTSRNGDAELSMLAKVKEYMGITEDLDLLFGGEE